MNQGLSWPSIVRLGLVQTSLGAVVVMMTSTLNRVMVVELALPALVPGLLVAVHHGVQVLRPAWGHGSDVGGKRTPWILAGMATLSLGGFLAALGVALTAAHAFAGLALSVLGFLAVGIGAGAAGTSVLAMLATGVAPQRRAAAATIVWVMMIFGFALTAPLAGHFLDPYSPTRLLQVMAGVSLGALALSSLAVAGVERRIAAAAAPQTRRSLRDALTQVWSEPQARRFTAFIFVSMLAYSAQELLVEPFAGLVFGMPPGVTTKLAGLQHGGVLIGMILVAVLASGLGGRRLGSLKGWTMAGCLASALALLGIAASGRFGADPLALRAGVAALGFSNGVFAVAAIGSMMGLAGAGARGHEGARMGLWGAAQAVAFALGGVVGTGLADLGRALGASPLDAYAVVFVIEAAAFVASAELARRVAGAEYPQRAPSVTGAAPAQT
jgi:BCD family chlorophyll transporter-like MFS transporter